MPYKIRQTSLIVVTTLVIFKASAPSLIVIPSSGRQMSNKLLSGAFISFLKSVFNFNTVTNSREVGVLPLKGGYSIK